MWIFRALWLLVPLVPKGELRYSTKQKSKSIIMRILAVLLRPFVGGRFMTGYWTTIGTVIYHPRPRVDSVTMFHEIEHVRQFYRWGILFPLLYVLALPVGFNPFRFYWELQAYKISMRFGMSSERVLQLLTGPEYGWTMPRFIAKRFIQ